VCRSPRWLGAWGERQGIHCAQEGPASLECGSGRVVLQGQKYNVIIDKDKIPSTRDKENGN